MLSRSFKSAKCKTSLKLAAARIKLLKNKREAQLKQLKRDVAKLLESGQEQTARIRVDHVVREEKTMAAYDILELYCELIVARLPIIESQKNCPIDLKEPIASIIFASPRCADVPELMDVRKHFTKKYGKEFITSALELRPDCGVNCTIIEKLSAKTPDGETKIKILTAIAQEHSVKWDPAALEGQVLKPNEDLLNGPSKFVSASKMHVESPNMQVQSPPSQKYEPATKSAENDVNRSSQKSRPISASMGAPVSMPSTSTPDLGAAGGVTEGEDFRQSLSKEETSLNRQHHWNMEFKDATSAAQAAAESAEMASMAARAAAELARHGNVTREYSTKSHSSSFHGPRDEGHGRSADWKFKDEGVEVDSARRENESRRSSLGMKPRMQSKERYEAEAGQDLSRAAENAYDCGSTNIYSSRPVSSHSKAASVDENTALSSPKVDATNQNRQGEGYEKGDKKQSSRRSSTNSSMSSLDDEIVVEQKSDVVSRTGFTDVESFNKNQQSTKVEMDDHLGVGNIGKQSGNSALSSSYMSPIGNDDIWDLNVQSYEKDMNRFSNNSGQVNTESSTEKPSLSNYSQVCFDESGSDCDTHLELESDNNGRHFDSYFPPQEAPSSFHLSSSIEPFRSKQLRSESLLNSNSNVFVESSEAVAKETVPSQSDELLATTFDDSDGLNSEIEEGGDDFKLRERMESRTSPSNQNVSARSVSSSLSGHGPTVSFGKIEDTERENQNAMLYNSDDDSDLEEGPSKSDQEAKLNVVVESGKRYEPADLLSNRPSPGRRRSLRKSSDLARKPLFNLTFGDQQLLQSSRLPLDKEVRDKDNFYGQSSPPSAKDSEYSDSLSIEDEKELNFRRLTGGLRNKGFSRPPYVRGHSTKTAVTSTEQMANETPTVTDKPTVLSLDEASVSSETRDNELYSNKPRANVPKEPTSNTKTYFDSDSDDAEVQPLPTVASRGHRGIRLSQRTRDSPKQSVMSSPWRFSGKSEVPVSSDFGLESGQPHKLDETPPVIGKSTISFSDKKSMHSEAYENMLSNQKPRANARKELISTPKSDTDSDTDGAEVIIPHRTPGSRGYQDAMQSRRPRDSQLQSEMGSPRRVGGRSALPFGSDFGAGSKLSKLSSSAAETTPKPPTETVISENRQTSKSLQPDPSIQRPSKFLPPSEFSVRKESFESSQLNLASEQPARPLSRTPLSGRGESQKSLSSSGGLTSRENSVRTASHVHPKLPDYEKVTAHLEALRLNRRSQ